MKYLYFILFILFVGCNINDKLETHGISNLKLKVAVFKLNLTNKNDVENIIGPSLIKDSFDNNVWYYFEVKKKTNYFGKKNIILNDFVILNFDQNGLLANFKFFDLKNLKNYDFNIDLTTTTAVDNEFFKNLFASTKKRMEMSKEKVNMSK